MDAEQYFPADYRAARAAFLAAARAAGAECVVRVHPRAMGPEGKPLFLDVAALGPRDARRALLVLSGLHGVEGPFGSAVQTGWLRETNAAARADDARVVLVHALNPFGFAWNRRVNEDNVDVNRNFLADFAHPPANPGQAVLADALTPRAWTEKTRGLARQAVTRYGEAHGAAALRTALIAGQYEHPNAPYFGGDAPSWSAQMLDVVLREHLPRVESLIVLDLHTGLGAPGTAEMIVEYLPHSPAYARAKAIWGAVASSAAGESVAPPLHGTLDQAWGRLLPGGDVLMAVLEVGTVPPDQAYWALCADNWLHRQAGGPGHRQGPAIAAALRAAFCPADPGWRRAAFAAGKTGIDAARDAL